MAECLTNLVTVDLDLADCEDIEAINIFLCEKNTCERKHLISGSPASQLLSYLLNVDMFDMLATIAQKQKITMSIYVDDVVFSSKYKISKTIQNRFLKVIHLFGFSESKGKIKSYLECQGRECVPLWHNKDKPENPCGATGWLVCPYSFSTNSPRR